MHLSGSCRCGKVTFTLESSTPYPYMRCYCGICRKTAGSGGYAINIMGEAASLAISGSESIAVFHAEADDGPSPGERRFCRHCGSFLMIWDPRWPENVYPFAGAIDTPLPTPPETVHIMLDFKAPWIDVPDGPGHSHFPRYPDRSIEDWHRERGLLEGPS